jgi:hypothetical protein
MRDCAQCWEDPISKGCCKERTGEAIPGRVLLRIEIPEYFIFWLLVCVRDLIKYRCCELFPRRKGLRAYGLGAVNFSRAARS